MASKLDFLYFLVILCCANTNIRVSAQQYQQQQQQQQVITVSWPWTLTWSYVVAPRPCGVFTVCCTTCVQVSQTSNNNANYLICPNYTRTTTRCDNNMCPAGNSCVQGFCCPTNMGAVQCPNGKLPVAGCNSNGACGYPDQYTCVGNFCCPR